MCVCVPSIAMLAQASMAQDWSLPVREAVSSVWRVWARRSPSNLGTPVLLAGLPGSPQLLLIGPCRLPTLFSSSAASPIQWERSSHIRRGCACRAGAIIMQDSADRSKKHNSKERGEKNTKHETHVNNDKLKQQDKVHLPPRPPPEGSAAKSCGGE